MGLIETYGKDLVGQYFYCGGSNLEVLCLIENVIMRRSPYRSVALIKTIVSNVGNLTCLFPGGLLDTEGVVISEKCAKFILLFAKLKGHID